MVTLAFAQAGSILALQEPLRLDRRRGGLRRRLPRAAGRTVGVMNTATSTGSPSRTPSSVFVIVQWAVDSSPGHVWPAIRENELRVAGARPAPLRVQADVVRARRGLATAGGVVYVLLLGGATPDVTTAELHPDAAGDGGARRPGTRWGAMLGGILYMYARPPARRPSGLDARSRLPAVLARPCSSRCSSWACSSSSWCSSSPEASRKSTACAGRRHCNDSRRRSADEHPLGFAGNRDAAAP